MAVSRILAAQADPVAEEPAELFYKLVQMAVIIPAEAAVAAASIMVQMSINLAEKADLAL